MNSSSPGLVESPVTHLLVPALIQAGWRKLALGAIPPLFAVFPTCLLGQQPIWQKLADQARSAVVTIDTTAGSGGGFFVKSDGTLVTSLRTTESGELKTVRLASGEVFERAHVLTTDTVRGLAIVRVEAFDVATLPLGNSNQVQVGEEVLLMNAAAGAAGPPSTASITRIQVIPPGVRVIQLSRPVLRPMDGGPVLNAEGEVIGVSASAEEGIANHAIAINYVRGMLDALPLEAGRAPPAREGAAPVVKPSAPKPAPPNLQSQPATPAVSVEAPQTPATAPSAPPRILFAGYGQNQKYEQFFEYIFVEIMNHLTAGGVNLANKPGEIRTLAPDPIALNELLNGLPAAGAGGLVFLRVDTNEVGWHWLTLECFDRQGVRAWQEKSNSLWSGAMTPSGCARAALNRMADKLKRHFGEPCLPTRGQPPAGKSTKPASKR